MCGSDETVKGAQHVALMRLALSPHVVLLRLP